MSRKDPTPTFVLTLPLVAKPAEDKTMFARMEAGRRLYNAVLGEGLRRLDLMKQSKAWQAARKSKDKNRNKEFARISLEFGFTASSLTTFARECKNEANWTDRIGSNVAQALAERVFNALQQYSFGKRGRPRFKGTKRPLHSLEAKNNKANIIWQAATGCVDFGNLTLPAILPTKTQDPYIHEALANRTKYCRIVWRNIKGVRRWFVQLMQEGLAPVKHETADGEIVGLDIGPSMIAIVGDGSASLVKFCATVEQPWKKVKKLQRKMDRSIRATNPQCFNENGTWKKGAKFVPSKHYIELQKEYAEVERCLAAERKRSHGELTNQILGLGTVVKSETLSYVSFQKKYGKSVKVRAPGMMIDMLGRKAENAGGKLVDLNTWKLKMSQFDHTSNTCTKKLLSQRWHVLGDGSGVVQRDVYSAFLARCVVGNTHHLSHIDEMWAAQKPALIQTGWLRLKAAKIEPQGKITQRHNAVASERLVCERRLDTGHGQDVVVLSESLKTPVLLLLEPPGFCHGEV